MDGEENLPQPPVLLIWLVKRWWWMHRDAQGGDRPLLWVRGLFLQSFCLLALGRRSFQPDRSCLMPRSQRPSLLRSWYSSKVVNCWSQATAMSYRVDRWLCDFSHYNHGSPPTAPPFCQAFRFVKKCPFEFPCSHISPTVLPNILEKPEGPRRMLASSCKTWVLDTLLQLHPGAGLLHHLLWGLVWMPPHTFCQWLQHHELHPTAICCRQLLHPPTHGSTAWLSHGQERLRWLSESQLSSCSPRFVRSKMLSPHAWLEPCNTFRLAVPCCSAPSHCSTTACDC